MLSHQVTMVFQCPRWRTGITSWNHNLTWSTSHVTHRASWVLLIDAFIASNILSLKFSTVYQSSSISTGMKITVLWLKRKAKMVRSTTNVSIELTSHVTIIHKYGTTSVVARLLSPVSVWHAKRWRHTRQLQHTGLQPAKTIHNSVLTTHTFVALCTLTTVDI